MDLPVFALDIETDTAMTDQARADNIADPGLHPGYGQVLDISVSGDGWSQVFTGPEEDILIGLEMFLQRSLPGVLVTWNGSGFDMPYLHTRYDRLGLTSSLVINYDSTLPVRHGNLPGFLGGYRASWGSHDHVDLMPLYQEEADLRGVTNSLKPVYEAIFGEKPVTVDRSRMHLLTLQERYDYVTSDTVITRRLALWSGIQMHNHLDSRLLSV